MLEQANRNFLEELVYLKGDMNKAHTHTHTHTASVVALCVVVTRELAVFS